MTYPMHLFRSPGPYGIARTYEVAGAADAAEEKELLAKGWHPTKEAAWGLKAKRPQLDHDDNGKEGGSKAPEPTEDLPALRAEYQEKMGKRPFPGWGADELRKRMA